MRRRIVRLLLALILLILPAGRPAPFTWEPPARPAHAAAGGLTLSPSSGPGGTYVLVSTSGAPFDPHASITISFSDSAQRSFPINHVFSADASGNLSGAQIQIPTGSAPGDGTVTATEFSPGSQTASGVFTVANDAAASPTPTPSPTQPSGLPTATSTPSPSATPTSTGVAVSTSLQIVPASGVPGLGGVSVVAPAGSFAYYATVSLSFIDANLPALTIALGSFVAANDGSVHASVSIPTGATAGSARFVARSSAAEVDGAFTVVPRLTIAPSIWAPGDLVAVGGIGFVPNRVVALAVEQQGITTVATDGNGAFATSVVVPSNLLPGPGTLTATDLTDSAVQAGAPFTVALLSPSPSATVSASRTATGTRTATATHTATETRTVTETRTATATRTDTPTHTATATRTPRPSPTDAVPLIVADAPTPTGDGATTTAYFAEGYTGQAASNGKATFSEVLNLLNPSTVEVPASITYFVEGSGTPLTIKRIVPAASVLRESVNADVGADRSVGALVSAPGRLVASRTISRVAADGSRLDGSASDGTLSPATRWDFPEGYTGISFQEYLTVLNPGSVPALVRIALAPQGTSVARVRSFTLAVPAQSRATANVRGLNADSTVRSVGLLVTSTVPIVAERVEYFGSGAGSGKFGSTVSLGLRDAARLLHLGYGASGGLSRLGGSAQPLGAQGYITLLNPAASGAPALVTAHFARADSRPLGQQVAISVAPGRRQTIAVNAAVGATAVGPFSVTLSATSPIEAELAQYYGGSPNAGSHPGVVVAAAPAATTDALLSDLSTRLIDGADVRRTLYLYNPFAAPMQVLATYFDAAGDTSPAAYTLPADGIATIDVQRAEAGMPAGPLGVQLRAVGGAGFLATAIGHTIDGRSYTEDVSSAP